MEVPQYQAKAIRNSIVFWEVWPGGELERQRTEQGSLSRGCRRSSLSLAPVEHFLGLGARLSTRGKFQVRTLCRAPGARMEHP